MICLIQLKHLRFSVDGRVIYIYSNFQFEFTIILLAMICLIQS